MCDEVYEHLMYDGLPHQSMLRYPDLAERSFVCYSFGKTYHCTGWKLGYCITSPELTAEFRKVHQFNCFSCHSPSQVALATFLKNKEAYLSLGAMMQEKRDYFLNLMQRYKIRDYLKAMAVISSAPGMIASAMKKTATWPSVSPKNMA